MVTAETEKLNNEQNVPGFCSWGSGAEWDSILRSANASSLADDVREDDGMHQNHDQNKVAAAADAGVQAAAQEEPQLLSLDVLDGLTVRVNIYFDLVTPAVNKHDEKPVGPGPATAAGRAATGTVAAVGTVAAAGTVPTAGALLARLLARAEHSAAAPHKYASRELAAASRGELVLAAIRTKAARSTEGSAAAARKRAKRLNGIAEAHAARMGAAAARLQKSAAAASATRAARAAARPRAAAAARHALREEELACRFVRDTRRFVAASLRRGALLEARVAKAARMAVPRGTKPVELSVSARRTAAALRLQVVARAWLARVALRCLERAAARLQAAVRGLLARALARRSVLAAVGLQAPVQAEAEELTPGEEPTSDAPASTVIVEIAAPVTCKAQAETRHGASFALGMRTSNDTMSVECRGATPTWLRCAASPRSTKSPTCPLARGFAATRCPLTVVGVFHWEE